MKLGTLLLVASAVAATGCASTCPPAPATAATPTSTTRLTSAELTETESAPLVGKSQHGASIVDELDDSAEPKKDTRRERRPSSGFSGYK